MEQLVFLGIGMLLLGVPMCLAGICSGTLRQQRRAAAFFWRQGWLYDLWVGRTLRILMWTIWGLGMSSLLLLQFHVYERAGWLVLILIIPLFSDTRRLRGRTRHREDRHEHYASSDLGRIHF